MARVSISGFIKEVESSSGPKSHRRHSSKAMLAKRMPNLVRHAGNWKGRHYHIDIDGKMLSQHRSLVECIFPVDGFFHYIHKETITRRNGHQEVDVAKAIYQDDKLWLHNDKFEGSASELKSGVVLFDLTRRDNLRSSVKEMLSLDASGTVRSRAISWFEDGHLIKRSLCNEQRVD